jgi:GT2 family glycosyltransferase
MLLRRSCLQQVGLFDERYFAYCEEADLGVRATRAGWEVGVVWHALVHNSSLSAPVAAVEYLKLRNTLLLVRQHFGRYPVSIRLAMALVDTAAGAVVRSRRPDPFPVSARLRAIADFGRGHFGPPPASLLAARA